MKALPHTLSAIIVSAIPAVMVAQTLEGTAPTLRDPCEHPVMAKARSEGLNALSASEVPEFLYWSWRCKRLARKEDRSVDFGQLYREKWEENYKESQEISGLGAAVLTGAVLILFYSYTAFLLGAESA